MYKNLFLASYSASDSVGRRGSDNFKKFTWSDSEKNWPVKPKSNVLLVAVVATSTSRSRSRSVSE